MQFQDFREEQMRLASQVALQDKVKHPKTLGGVAINYVDNKQVVACVTTCDAKTFKVLDFKIVTRETAIPYKPGFLAYRVLPAVVDAYNELEVKPDILFVSGHGINHPRRIGFASHLGLLLDVPTVGVAQALLVGSVQEGKVVIRGEQCGFELKSREHAKPIYVSPGHMVSLGTALNLIKNSIKPPHKMPEPIHLANKIAKKELRQSRKTSS